MRIYDIFDEENSISIGTLLYYEKAKTFVIELREYLDEWSAPLLFTDYVKNGIYTIPRDISFLWVQERVIPSDRQNIGAILSNHNLKEYDEMKLLELSNGRCSQDALCIRNLTELPEYVIVRNARNLTDCVICDDHMILCFFVDDTIKKIDLSRIKYKNIDKVVKNESLFRTGQITAGGYSVSFNDSIDIPANVLYSEGTIIPLKQSDFISFIKSNVYDTSKSCVVLGCSRQNLSYLAREHRITPIKEVRGTLYLKGDIMKAGW